MCLCCILVSVLLHILNRHTLTGLTSAVHTICWIKGCDFSLTCNGLCRMSDAKLDSLAAAAATDGSQASISRPQQAHVEATAQRQPRAQTFEAAYTQAHAAEERQPSGAVVSTEGVSHSLPSRRASEQPSTLSRKQKRPSPKVPFARKCLQITYTPPAS